MDKPSGMRSQVEDGKKIGPKSNVADFTPEHPIEATSSLESNEEYGLYTNSGAEIVLNNFFCTPRPTPFKEQKSSTKLEDISGNLKMLMIKDLGHQTNGLSPQNQFSDDHNESTPRIASPILLKYHDALKLCYLPSNYSGFTGVYMTPASGVFSPYPNPKFSKISHTTTGLLSSIPSTSSPPTRPNVPKVSLIQAQIRKFEKQRFELQKILDDSDDSLERRLTCTLREIGMILNNRRGYKTEMKWILAKIQELKNELTVAEVEKLEVNVGILTSSVQDLDLSDGCLSFIDDDRHPSIVDSETKIRTTRASKPLPPLPRPDPM